MNTNSNTTNALAHLSVLRTDVLLSAWRKCLRIVPSKPWLAYSRALLQRFSHIGDQRRSQPHPGNRRRQRRLGVSLVAGALALALANSPTQALPSPGANAQINGSVCDLVDAIIAANTDAPSGACNAGQAGADTISLLSDVTLTTGSFYAYFNDTGLPQVDTPITMEGNGYTIRRASSTPDRQRIPHTRNILTWHTDEARFRLMTVGSSGDLTLNDITLSNGYANHWNGGAIYNRGNLSLSNSTLSGNSTAVNGGAIYTMGGAITLTNDSFVNNSSDSSGGALFNNGGSVTVVSTLFANNSSGSGGGGLYNSSGADVGQMTISNSTLSGNSAADASGGGAIRNSRGTVTVSYSTLSDNSAGYGGGIHNGDHLYLINSTLSGNSATDSKGGTGAGGGIASSGDVFQVQNSTITGNSAITGGGIAVILSGLAALERSIISGNLAANGAELYSAATDCLTAAAVSICRTSSAAIGADAFNLFGHSGESNAQAFSGFTPTGSDITATSDGTTPTALTAILNPVLADNGGPVTGSGQAILTHALAVGSPAFDAAGDSRLATDQRGVARPQGSADDIGAVEVKVINNSVTPGPTTTFNNPTPQFCAATGTDLAIYTITTSQQNSSVNTFTDLFFRVKTLEYTADQGGKQPNLCNATTVVDNGGVGSLLVISNSSLPGGDNAFNPGDTLRQAFAVGRPVTAQFRIKVDLFSSTATAAGAGVVEERYLGSFDYVFDPTNETFSPVQQLFLPLVNR